MSHVWPVPLAAMGPAGMGRAGRVTTVEIVIAADPPHVFGVLSDGWYYSDWVTGTSHIRAVDAEWPAIGSRIHHASGIWPLVLHDETRVDAITPDQRLVLLAEGKALGTARVVIELEPVPGPVASTKVTMSETPVSGPGRWVHNPALAAVLRRRNAESLTRLRALAERRTAPDQH